MHIAWTFYTTILFINVYGFFNHLVCRRTIFVLERCVLHFETHALKVEFFINADISFCPLLQTRIFELERSLKNTI